MVRGFGIICCLAVGLLMGVGSAQAVGPIDFKVATEVSPVRAISFFGRPYPYGYTGWGPCIRYVEVETRWGPRLRRIWVCR